MLPASKVTARRAATVVPPHVGASTDSGRQSGVGIYDAHFGAMSLNRRGLCFSPHSVPLPQLDTPCGIKDEPRSSRVRPVYRLVSTHAGLSVVVEHCLWISIGCPTPARHHEGNMFNWRPGPAHIKLQVLPRSCDWWTRLNGVAYLSL